MKNIEINEKQKENLLEMCKELFPKYDFRINKPLFSNNESLSTVQFGKKSKTVYGKEIHWFEFCMTHLKDKLQDKLEKVNKLDYNYQMKSYDSWWESHPIDYLYEEFKKLKL